MYIKTYADYITNQGGGMDNMVRKVDDVFNNGIHRILGIPVWKGGKGDPLAEKDKQASLMAKLAKQELEDEKWMKERSALLDRTLPVSARSLATSSRMIKAREQHEIESQTHKRELERQEKQKSFPPRRVPPHDRARPKSVVIKGTLVQPPPIKRK